MLGTATNQSVIELVDAIQAENSGRGLEIIHKALDGGTDARQYARQIVDYLRDLLIIKLQAGQDLELTPEDREKMTEQSANFETTKLIDIITAFTDASTDLKANWHPGLGLELALAASMYQAQPTAAPQAEAQASSPTQLDSKSESVVKEAGAKKAERPKKKANPSKKPQASLPARR